MRLNQAAADYYSVLVSRMHVNPAQRAAQQEWVAGVRTLGHGDEQLSDGIQSARTIPPHAAAKRQIQSALTTFRHADSHADAVLDIHESAPTVALPTKVIYEH